MAAIKPSKREDLRKRLVDAAESEIAEKGLKGLKARDVTAKAGCALGALYNSVQDLDQLVILVNSRTLGHLGETLRAAVPANASPVEVMKSLAGAYVAFAIAHPRLWSAVFFHRLPDGVEMPEWYKNEHAVLIAQLIEPLSKLRPDLAPDALRLRAQTLFAAVHGVVQLSFHGRYVGTPIELLESEVLALVDAMTRGLSPVDPADK